MKKKEEKISSVTIRIPKELHKQVKLFALIREVKMVDIFIEGVKKILHERGENHGGKGWKIE